MTNAYDTQALIERLHERANVLNEAAAFLDGRTVEARRLRETASLLSEAAFFVEGVNAERRRNTRRDR